MNAAIHTRVGDWVKTLWKRIGNVVGEQCGKIVTTSLLILVWSFFFALGNVIDSKFFREMMDEAFKQGHLRVLGTPCLQYITTWTWTNVGILACLASVIGESGRELARRGAGRERDYRRALVRGFFVYLTAIGGYLVIEGQISDVTTLQEYTRIAVAVSVVGFLAGFAPRFFGAVVSRLAEQAIPENQAGQEGRGIND